MTSLSRSASLVVARAGLAVAVLSLLGFGVWTIGDLLGQAPAQNKPRKEEEEESPKAKRTKPNRNVIPPEDDDPKEKSPAKHASEPAVSGNLNQLAEQAAYPSMKNLCRSLAVPYDEVVFKRYPGVTVTPEKGKLPPPRDMKIEPIPQYLGKNPGRSSREPVTLTPLTKDGQPGESLKRNPHELEVVRPYEEIAQDKVRRFLETNNDSDDAAAAHPPSRHDKLIAAEQALSAVLRWHESERQTGKRSGEDWASVEKALRKQLLDEVQLEQMKVLIQGKDYDRVVDLAKRLADTYPDADERERIFRPVADLIRDPKANDDKAKQALKRLADLATAFPSSSALEPIRETLRSKAQSLLDQAELALKEKNEEQARRCLKSARETFPGLPELRAFAIKLNTDHPELRVGVPGPLPRYFSPAWACTDSERRAVELLFESLVKMLPDADGGFRYCPGLAESPPQVVPLGRRFQLPQNAFWSDGRPLSSTDIEYSLMRLQNGTGTGRSRVWGDLLEKTKGESDPFQVTLRLKQGFIDPLALMTYKILPRDLDVNSEEFARKPVSGGPFRLDGPRFDELNQPCLVFTVNPYYGLRPMKRDAPHIEKISFYTYGNAEKELLSGKLDLVLDLTAEQAQALLEKQKGDGPTVVVPLPSSSVPNRRIYFLAINTRKLPDAKLRRALAFAIDRETLLNERFRAKLKTPLHRVLNGPFPAGSWACPDKKGFNLFDADAAKNLSVAVEKPAGLKLKYPNDNPALEDAMKDLCAQVKKWTGVDLERVPCDPYQLREDVEERQSYDLAYYHYDFPDDSYWLAPLLGPPPRADRDSAVANIFRFKNSEIERLVAGTESYRDFAMVRKYQRMLHKRLCEEMPFIPLWQLDPLLAYRRGVEPKDLDPLVVFSNIEEWRVKPR